MFDKNRAVQPKKMARLEISDLESTVEGLHFLCSENKGTDQLSSYHAADLQLCFSHMQKSRFSHDVAHSVLLNK